MSVRVAPLLFFAGLAACTGDRPASFHFAIIGDRAGEPDPRAFERVVRDVAGLHPDFVVMTGDLVEDWRDPTEWDRTLGAMSQLTCPVHYVPGNHDIEDAASAALFRKNTGSRPYYAFDYGAAHFVVVNSATAGSYEELDVEQKRWLEADLTGHSGAKSLLVFMHRPLFGWNDLLADPFHALLERTGVDAVFAAHLHRYAHDTVDGIDYYIVGSSGGEVQGLQDVRLGNAYQFLWAYVDEGSLASVRVVQSGAIHDPDLLSLSDLDPLYRIDSNGVVARASSLTGRQAELQVDVTNSSSAPLDEVLEIQSTPSWRVSPSSRPVAIAPRETASFLFELERLGSLYPLPVVRMGYRLPSGRRVPLRRVVDLSLEVRIPAPRRPPVLDGSFSEEEWSGSTRLAEFGNARGQPSAGDPTRVYLLGNEESLYFAAVCSEHELDHMRVHHNGRDSKVVYDDRIGMLLSPDQKNVYWFYVNPNGAIWDLHIDNESGRVDPGWNGDFDVGVGRLDDAWVVEMRIPLRQMSHDVRRPEWRFNIRRKQERNQSEALLVPWFDYHDPSRWAKMEPAAAAAMTRSRPHGAD